MVYLFSSVYDDVTILTQFIEHYRQVGVDCVVLNINTHANGLMVQQVEARIRNYPVLISYIYNAPQTWQIQNRLRNRAQELFMKQEDWALIADLDEFQEYPHPLSEVFQNCEERGDNCIYGTFLDRVSSSGELPSLRADWPVSIQFPVGVPLTREILRAPSTKIVAVKGHLKPPMTCIPMARTADFSEPRISPIQATIHHYKWHAGVLRKLRERALLYKTMFQAGNPAFRNYQESERFLCYFEARGRIAVEEFSRDQVRRFHDSQSTSTLVKSQ